MSKNKSSHVETTTLARVPDSEKMSWTAIALIQAGIMICVPSLMLGGILAQSMNMIDAILSGLIGYALITVVMVLIGIMGSDLGVPTCMVASGCFGKKGSARIISAVFMISMIGWFAVQNWVCGNAFTNLMANVFGIAIPVWVSAIVLGIIMLLTAIYGIKALDKLNTIAVPALVIVTTIGCFLAFQKFGTASLMNAVETPSMSFLDGVVLTISFMATGALNAPDFTRYQKNRKDVVLSSTIGVMPAGIAMLILGAFMTKIASEYDITLVFAQVGIPVLGLIVLMLATWTTNTTNAYSAGMDAVMVFGLKDDKRAMATIVLGGIGIVLSALGISNFFESFLYLLGDTFMPIVAIFLIEYYLICKGKASDYQLREGWYWGGILAWGFGFAATRIPWGVSFINGMIIAGLCYLAFRLVLKDKNTVESRNEIADEQI